ncbi:glycosyltransferase family 2 protein [Candidatus Saccharibacteria bacterium]|nr:glycosyltransferase family 2 protein [Candidatus Saccharibacteria bacterium]
MKHKPLLTIGIPAYNVELYIEDTVLSVAKSKHHDELEILIVNDGSSDQTLEVANRLAKEHNCIKVINKPNGGHGSAINTALKNATGKYFRLLDGDDWFNTDEFDHYFEKLETETADIIFTDLIECFIKSNLNRPVSYYSHLPSFTEFQLDETVFPEWGPMLPTTTIKTSLLKQFGLKIDEKCFYVDQEYNLACYLAAKTAIYYPFMIYQYRLEREGQSMEKASLIKNVASHEQVCKKLLSVYHKNLPSMSATRQEYIANRVIIPMCHMQYMIATEWCKSRKYFTSFDKILKKYPKFYQNPGIAGTLTNFHRKTKGLFIKIDPIIRKMAEKKNQSEANHNLKHSVLIFLGCLIPIIIANIIVTNYVNSEQTVYYWDTSAYWKNSIDLLNTFNQSKPDAFTTIAKSLNTDYNLLPIAPMLPFLAIFGTSRLTYIVIILNLYALPFAFFMTKTIKALFNRKHLHIKKWLYPVIFSIFLLSPTTLIPILNGRPDAICLLIISLILYLLAKTRLKYISNYFVLGFLTFLLIVLRRYFCFWAISLYIAIFIAKLISHFHSYDFSKTFLSKTLKVAIKLFASGILILGLMLLLVHSLLVRYLTGGYGDAYSAYMLGDFFNQIKLFIQYYGLIFLTLAIAGIIVIYAKYRKSAISEFTNICIVSSLLSFLFFTRVQTLGDQHMYMFVPFLTFCVASLTVKLHTIKKIRILAIIPAIIILCLSLYSFNGSRSKSCSPTCYITGISEVIRPIQRQDLNSLNTLSQDLSNLMSFKDYVYTLSSSDAFSDDILRNLNLPNYPEYNISGVMHVDKRDGFPSYFFDATYIIVANPVQTHLSEGSQDVIVYLANQILAGNTTNLKLINTYQLDNGVSLNLYHKESKYSDNFLKETKQYFQNKYPNYPFLYETIPETDPLVFQ